MGGFVNDLLAWPVFAPLSRLTYCCYLIHQVSATIVADPWKLFSFLIIFGWSCQFSIHQDLLAMFNYYVILSFPNDVSIICYVYSLINTSSFMCSVQHHCVPHVLFWRSLHFPCRSLHFLPCIWNSFCKGGKDFGEDLPTHFSNLTNWRVIC